MTDRPTPINSDGFENFAQRQPASRAVETNSPDREGMT